MLRTQIGSHTLVLWLTLAAATAGAGCSSGGSDADDPPTMGTSGGSAGQAAVVSVAGSGMPSAAGGAAASTAGTGSTVGTGSTGSTDRGGSTGSTDRGGSGGTDDKGGSGGGGGGSGPDVAAAVMRGLALATTNQCTTCHQDDYAGYAIYPNITPDADTGIGSWSDQEIIDAIRTEKGKGGSTLCNLMVQFPFNDGQVTDLVAFLRSLPAKSNAVDEVCPGHVP